MDRTNITLLCFVVAQVHHCMFIYIYFYVRYSTSKYCLKSREQEASILERVDRHEASYTAGSIVE